jgi:alkylation response protein AidB-like acyl-CoA dehydrogenase
MDADGVEVVPIKKLTGEYGFAQTFFTDARFDASSLVGEEGDGWKVAMATLTYERGATGGQAGGHAMMNSTVADVIALARKARRAGQAAIEDALVRDRLVQLLIEERMIALNARRAKVPALVSERPASIPLAAKLVRSEFNRRLNQFAVSLQGGNAAYYVGDDNAADGGLWQRGYFNAFSSTIGGGTSQIQKNILGERVLGLPKS